MRTNFKNKCVVHEERLTCRQHDQSDCFFLGNMECLPLPGEQGKGDVPESMQAVS